MRGGPRPDLLLFRSLVLLIPRAKGPLALRNLEKRRIELDKCGIDRSVILMAGVAGRFLRSHLRRLRIIEPEEPPLARQAGLVFHMHFKPHHFSALKVAALINRAPAFRF